MNNQAGIFKQMNKAKRLKKAKKWKKALRIYADLLDQLDMDARGYLRLQKERLKKGDIKGAARIAVNGGIAAPSSKILRSQRMLMYIVKRDFTKVKQVWRKTPEKEKYVEKIITSMSDCLIRLKKPKQAEEMFHKGLGLYPNNPALHLASAMFYFKQTDWKQSAYHYQKAKKLNVDFKPSERNRYAVALTERGAYQFAEGIIEEGLERFPTNQLLLERMVIISATQKNWSEVIHRGKTLLKEIGDERKAKNDVQATIAAAHLLLNQQDVAHRWLQEEHEQYLHKKLVLFEDKDGSIEWYKLNPHPSTVILLFEDGSEYDQLNNKTLTVIKDQQVDLIRVSVQEEEIPAQHLKQIEQLTQFYAVGRAIGYGRAAQSALFYSQSLQCEATVLNPEWKSKYRQRSLKRENVNIFFTSEMQCEEWNAEAGQLEPQQKGYPLRLKGIGQKNYKQKNKVFETSIRELITNDKKLRFEDIRQSYFLALAGECKCRKKEKWALMLQEYATTSLSEKERNLY